MSQFSSSGKYWGQRTFFGRGIDPALDSTNTCSHWDLARHLPAENHNSRQPSLHCSVRQLENNALQANTRNAAFWRAPIERGCRPLDETTAPRLRIVLHGLGARSRT